jgi:hypothetical protein
VKRFLVIFSSHPTPPADTTVVDVSAECAMSAMLIAKREAGIHHVWTFAQAVPWPRGCSDVDAAAERVCGRSAVRFR